MVPDAAWRIAQQIARHLGLGEVRELEAVDGGLLNRSLVAATSGGRWFLKGSRYVDPTPIVREHEVAAVARRANVPSPAPVAARDGTTTTWAGNRWWSTYPYVDGRHIARHDVDETVATLLGETLGRIHAALDDAPDELVRRLPTKAAPSVEATLDRIRAFEDEIVRRPVATAFDGHALASLAYRRSVIEADASNPWPGDGLITGVVHGDFHVGNVRFLHGNPLAIAAVLDWELAAVAPRALDVARALDLAIDLTTDLANGGPRLRAFAQGYGQHTSLGSLASARLPNLYRIARAHSLWVYEEHYRHGEAPTDTVAIDDLTTLQWWHRERDAIAEAVIAAFARGTTRQVISSREA
jgi:Ser/Thr protein kinase RdoA (MazF antagonist)